MYVSRIFWVECPVKGAQRSFVGFAKTMAEFYMLPRCETHFRIEKTKRTYRDKIQKYLHLHCR